MLLDLQIIACVTVIFDATISVIDLMEINELGNERRKVSTTRCII